MKLLKRLWERGTRSAERGTVAMDGAARAEKLRQLRVRLGQLPADDPLMAGLLAWQEERLGAMLRECDDRNMTGEQALSLVHRLAETAAFREDLERVWREERAKVEAQQKV